MSIHHSVQDQKPEQLEKKKEKKVNEHGGLADKHDTDYQNGPCYKV